VARHAVVKLLSFPYGHRIPGHGGPCAHLHGHNARVEVECSGELDPLGMVVDFGEIKRLLEGWVRKHWDHRMILKDDDPLAAALEEAGEPVYRLPRAPTAENLAAHLFAVARDAGLPIAAIRLWETETSMASYEGP